MRGTCVAGAILGNTPHEAHFPVQTEVIDVFAPYTPATRAASDHLPLVMDFEVA